MEEQPACQGYGYVGRDAGGGGGWRDAVGEGGG